MAVGGGLLYNKASGVLGPMPPGPLVQDATRMTGLNLETFLQLLRVDLGAWASLGLIFVCLALMTWTSWGSRRALRKCLVLSIAVHVGLIAFGSRSPVVQTMLRLGRKDPKPAEPAKRVRVTPWVDEDRSPRGRAAIAGRSDRKLAAWDRDIGPLGLAEADRPAPRPEPTPSSSSARPEPPAIPPPLATERVAPELASPPPPPVEAPRPVAVEASEGPPAVAPAAADEVGQAAVVPAPIAADPSPGADLPADADLRSRSRRTAAAAASSSPRATPRPSAVPPTAREPVALPPAAPVSAPTPALTPSFDRDLVAPARPAPARAPDPAPAVAVAAAAEDADVAAPGPAPAAESGPTPGLDLPDADVRRLSRPTRAPAASGPAAPPRRGPAASTPIDLARATPTGPSVMPASPRSAGRRSLSEVPPVYRSRLDPNRTALAQRSGASLASEQAVERALNWLSRHQDADGRWDGGTFRNRDGSVFGNDDSFTIHCADGEVCFGECYYPEADTALTGLALLAYLGAGYTHTDGKYAATVARGIDYLRRAQKPDGDLRGESLAVGMYCHSMATLALCEAYALTGDARLRLPVEKAVGFLARGRAADGQSWRYAPGAPVGDTSILGWAVMALKSAKVVGIPIPPPTQAGISAWLKKVATGPDGGLARYQPGKKETPTMTAEAWACRQFLEIGGPGRASDEAASYLLQNGSDGGEYNIYYLYYGTLAMYQHGGEAWSTWNARVRDQVVRRQRIQGHMAGSWDPDDTQYGTHGGRIYGTALATLTLEVYYRFLRLYEPSPIAPVAPRPGDAGTRRAGFDPRPRGR